MNSACLAWRLTSRSQRSIPKPYSGEPPRIFYYGDVYENPCITPANRASVDSVFRRRHHPCEACGLRNWLRACLTPGMALNNPWRDINGYLSIRVASPACTSGHSKEKPLLVCWLNMKTGAGLTCTSVAFRNEVSIRTPAFSASLSLSDTYFGCMQK